MSPGGRPDGVDGLAGTGRAVRDDASRLVGDLGRLASEVEVRLARRLDARPYGTLAIAAGAGYLLGGGVPAWLLRAGVAAGTRAVANVLIGEVFAVPGGPPPEPERSP